MMMMMMRFLFTVVLCIAALGCGTSVAGAPEKPPPRQPTPSGPPPAWVETRAGDRWLAYSSFCWFTTCAMGRPLEQRTDLPRIALARGEVARFHLQFRPTKLEVRVGQQVYRLAAARTAGWRVRGSGRFLMLIATGGRGNAEYAARVRIG